LEEKKLLWIIPAYNEAKSLDAVVEDILSVDPKAEYIIVSDGSTDGTVELCQKKGYSYLALPENLGLTACFQTGMRYADQRGFAFALQFDGDGQHRPEYIPEMRKKCEECDIVIVSRFVTKKKPFTMRMLGSRLIALAIKISTGATIHDPTSGMRMYNEKLITEFALRLNYAPEPDTISYLIKQGMRVCEIQGEMDERVAGISYLTPINAAKYMFRMLCSIIFIQSFREKKKI